MNRSDILIIGGGTAGLTAALYATRAGKSVILLEKTVCGGQILNAPLVENYPGRPNVSGVDLMMDLMAQATAFGADIRYEEVTSVNRESDGGFTVSTASGGDYGAAAVILACGRKNRPLGIDREEELIGHGISYCAACDGGFYKGKRTAVVGGGNTALHDALYLSDLCASVTLIHRRAEFRGEPHTLDQLKKRPNVHFVTDAVVSALLGEDRLEGVEISQKGETSILPVDGLFVAVGQLPQNETFSTLLPLDGGYIQAGESTLTAVDGVFAAGDCRTKEVYQLATAAADGAVAAMAAISYLSKIS